MGRMAAADYSAVAASGIAQSFKDLLTGVEFESNA